MFVCTNVDPSYVHIWKVTLNANCWQKIWDTNAPELLVLCMLVC